MWNQLLPVLVSLALGLAILGGVMWWSSWVEARQPSANQRAWQRRYATCLKIADSALGPMDCAANAAYAWRKHCAGKPVDKWPSPVMQELDDRDFNSCHAGCQGE